MNESFRDALNEATREAKSADELREAAKRLNKLADRWDDRDEIL